MISWRESRAALALLLATSLACQPLHGLIRLNDGHDHIHVTGTISAAHDSNIYANQDARSDTIYTSTIVAEYRRRAGWIGVNASVSVSASRFNENQQENFENPSFSGELTKQSGRTTGSLTLSVARESRADAAVNIRSESWNYMSGLNVRYPINALYSVTGTAGYSNREYVEETALADLSTYSAGVDLIRAFYERDLVAGYRYRFSETSRLTSTTDHSFTVGLNGKILRSLSGSIRGGYQVRTPEGGLFDGSFTSWTASGALTYAFNRRLNFSGQISKDFTTTATDSSVDVTAASIEGQYVYNARWSAGLSAGAGQTDFLSENRNDTYLTWGADLNYTLNEHFRLTLGYSWFQNWSTIRFADFVREHWALSISSRW